VKNEPLQAAVSAGAPPDPSGWDDLARRSGNLVQSTRFDGSEAFFGMRPVYFSVTLQGQLLGGVKVFESASSRWPALTGSLSRGMTQFGEALLPDGGDREQLRVLLDRALSDYLRIRRVVWFRSVGMYGGPDGLVAPAVPVASAWPFRVASVDLRRSENDLWAKLHKAHRAEIRKADQNKLAFIRSGEIDRLVSLLDETYRFQTKSGPNRAYVRHMFESLGQAAELFFAAKDGEYMAGAMCMWQGHTAYWQFGGTRRQAFGAGAFLQWKIIQHYRGRGLERYLLGQVAAEPDPANAKFAGGISRFKRHFGPEESPSEIRLYVLRPWRHRIWSGLAGTTAMMRKAAVWTTRR